LGKEGKRQRRRQGARSKPTGSGTCGRSVLDTGNGRSLLLYNTNLKLKDRLTLK